MILFNNKMLLYITAVIAKYENVSIILNLIKYVRIHNSTEFVF